MSAVCLRCRQKVEAARRVLSQGKTRIKVLLHRLQTGSRFSQRWAWGYETKVQHSTRGGACPRQRQRPCRRAKAAADGSLRRVHRCSWSPWSCTETAINCFDLVDAALGEVSKVFADYRDTNLVEILAFWIAVSIALWSSRHPEVGHVVPRCCYAQESRSKVPRTE